MKVLELLDRAPDLSSRLELISWFGTHPAREKRDEDAEMIGEQETADLLADFRSQVAGADPQVLAGERDFRVLVGGLVDGGEEAVWPIRQKATGDEFMLALVKAFFSEVRSRAGGDAAVHRIPSFDWAGLEALLGEELLQARVSELAHLLDGGGLDEDIWHALDFALKVQAGDAPASPFPAMS